jgi:hypothetical protein
MELTTKILSSFYSSAQGTPVAFCTLRQSLSRMGQLARWKKRILSSTWPSCLSQRLTPRRSESLVASCSDDLMAMSHTLDDSSRVRYSIALGILPNTLRAAAARDCTTELGLLWSRQRDAGTDKQRQAA